MNESEVNIFVQRNSKPQDAMEVPKYSVGTLVRILDPLQRYDPSSMEQRTDWEKRFSYLSEINYWSHSSNIANKECRILNWIKYRDEFVYLVQSKDYNYGIMIEKGLALFEVVGHKYLGELPIEFTDNKRYDVETWTPLHGGKYVKTIAVNVNKSEAQKLYDNQQDRIEKWRSMPSGGYPSWIDNVRVVEHVPRIYHAMKHESQLTDIYCFKKEIAAENLSLLLESAQYAYHSSEKLYSKKDMQVLEKKFKKEIIEKLKNELTTQTGRNDFNRVIKKLRSWINY